MTYIAKCNKGSNDNTEYNSVDEAIAAVTAKASVVRVDRPRENYAMVVCERGMTYSIVEQETPAENTSSNPRGDAYVTEKQQAFLVKLGNGRVHPRMPRRDASAIIDDILASR